MIAKGRTLRYVEVLDTLRADIAAGVFAVGAALPTEAALCRRFSVSRFTVREALRRLQADGMVSRVQGAGSCVLRDRPAGVFVQNYRSVSELSQYAAETRLDLLGITDTILSADLAARIGGKAGDEWVVLCALRRAAEGTPLALVESFVPRRFAALARTLVAGPGPIYDGLAASIGETVSDAVQETQALPAPHHVAEALNIDAGAPSLRLLRRYASASGTLIASFNWHLGGDRYIHRTRIDLSRP
ncbi:MAG: DNA-binding GntR family transcriptional regulator [Paracoccaceae bacterium]|jgi:DNA-binding GntR family transcriptional regulator